MALGVEAGAARLRDGVMRLRPARRQRRIWRDGKKNTCCPYKINSLRRASPLKHRPPRVSDPAWVEGRSKKSRSRSERWNRGIKSRRRQSVRHVPSLYATRAVLADDDDDDGHQALGGADRQGPARLGLDIAAHSSACLAEGRAIRSGVLAAPKRTAYRVTHNWFLLLKPQNLGEPPRLTAKVGSG